jgi:hypothetical protein
VTLASKNAPKPEFKKAFEAFRRHALDCMPFLADVRDKLKVTTVHLKVDAKSERRSLQVSFSVPLDYCQGKATSLTTPYMIEPADDAGDPTGFLEPHTVKMMEELVDRAERHLKGEHNGQVEMVIEETPEKRNGHRNGTKPEGKRGGRVAGHVGAMKDAAD